MSDKDLMGVPGSLKDGIKIASFKNNYLGFPLENENYNEFDKIRIKRGIFGKNENYTKLRCDLWICEFMDIPCELFKSVEFISEHTVSITFYESEQFCVEKYFQLNFDVIKDKNFIIKYLNKEGYAIRTDTYKVAKLNNVEKEPLSNLVENITVKITLECSNHGISTCKE